MSADRPSSGRWRTWTRKATRSQKMINGTGLLSLPLLPSHMRRVRVGCNQLCVSVSALLRVLCRGMRPWCAAGGSRNGNGYSEGANYSSGGDNGLVVELPDGKLFRLTNPNGRVVEMPNGSVVEMIDGQVVEMSNGQQLEMVDGSLLGLFSEPRPLPAPYSTWLSLRRVLLLFGRCTCSFQTCGGHNARSQSRPPPPPPLHIHIHASLHTHVSHLHICSRPRGTGSVGSGAQGQ